MAWAAAGEEAGKMLSEMPKADVVARPNAAAIAAKGRRSPGRTEGGCAAGVGLEFDWGLKVMDGKVADRAVVRGRVGAYREANDARKPGLRAAAHGE